MKSYKQKGFTLIELLVVVSIIGVLATIVISSLGEAKKKVNDSARIQTLKQMEIALELYYLDNDEYPRANYAWGVNNSGANYQNTAAQNFIMDISPYLKDVDVNEVFLGGGIRWGSFYYKSVAANNYQTYGAMIKTDSRPRASETDGGYFPSITTLQYSQSEGHNDSFFEIGQDPRYCRDTYFTSILGSLNRCLGGN